ncbi:hypothetical protein GCM10027569_72430 [Flindersiella endophytica]
MPRQQRKKFVGKRRENGQLACQERETRDLEKRLRREQQLQDFWRAARRAKQTRDLAR